jgi:adenylosuccinate synthase
MHKQSLAEIYRALEPVLGKEKSLVVIGANWGDEGKGKIIDLVMNFYDIVARFSGGANAGHTVMTDDGRKVVTHLIPTGLAQHKVSVIGRGEFFNISLFIDELAQISGILGGNMPPVYIDEMAPLWTPWHGLLETWLESARGGHRIGTTNKAIGPLAGLAKLRVSPVVSDLFDPKGLAEVLDLLYKSLSPIFGEMMKQKLVEAIPSSEQVAGELLALAPQLKDKVVDGSYFLWKQISSGKRVLFEGAQAVGLDSRWGTYPYVSSGMSVAAGAAVGTGLPIGDIGPALMVVKMLPTRVGRGPFPSEMWERSSAQEFPLEHPELFMKGEAKQKFLQNMLEKINSGTGSHSDFAQYFQVLGDERGATTGRGRSVGFIDLPWLRYAVRINGPKWLALTRFDMLSGLKSIPVVVKYKIGGRELESGEMPSGRRLEQVEPVFEQWELWPDNIYGATDTADLPAAAQTILARLEAELGVPVLLVGTGPERSAIIVR